ncbi:MAG: DUF58 domain-containing protein [Clostridia bacterium]|nr:DUF58 domain-containing protein [Clostridia bacterium]
MTGNRIKFGFILLVEAALLIFYHNFFFFYLLLITVMLAAVSIAVSRRVFSSIDVKTDIPLESVGEGNDIPVDFTVENKTPFPVPGIRLGYSVENGFYPNEEKQEMTLPVRRGKRTYRWTVSSVYAGLVTLTGSSMKMQDYLGLFVFEKEWKNVSQIAVFPGSDEIVMNIVENTFSQGEENDNESANASEDVTQIKDFRLYAPGDRMQRVNWKISAKYDDLYVKEFELMYDRTLTLLIELRRDSDEVGFLDELITAFYSAALRLIELEITFFISWFDVDKGVFRQEKVDDEDTLHDDLRQVFMMRSYEGYEAFIRYRESRENKNDTAVYFTTPGFDMQSGGRIGTYKDKVVLICL